MDIERAGPAEGEESGRESAAGRERGLPAWTVGRLIELLDEAIDAAGEQLARSGGLWGDASSGSVVAQRKDRMPHGARRGVGPRHSSAEVEEPPVEHGPGLP